MDNYVPSEQDKFKMAEGIYNFLEEFKDPSGDMAFPCYIGFSVLGEMILKNDKAKFFNYVAQILSVVEGGEDNG